MSNPPRKEAPSGASFGPGGPKLNWLAALISLLVTGTGPHGVRAFEFLPPVSYDLEAAEPVQLDAADFDGDLHVDLAASSYGPSSFDGTALTILLGDGAGGFSDNPSIESMLRMGGTAAADWNGDGHMDLAYALEDGSIRIVLGDGEAGFDEVESLAGGFDRLAAADFNGDDSADLVANFGLTIYLGQGSGSFSAPIGNSAAEISDLEVADMDGDAVPDLVCATHQGAVLVYRGDGDGTFTLSGSAGGGQSFVQWNNVSVGRLDGDMRPDVVWIRDYPYEVRAAFGAAGGALTGELTLDSYGTSPYDAAIADFNGDGRGDVAVTTRWSSLYLYAGDGAGGFQPGVPMTTGLEPEICRAVDLDEDYLADLAIVSRNAGDTPQVVVHLNRTPLETAVGEPGYGRGLGLLGPNPFRDHVAFSVGGSGAGRRLEIFDVAGRRIAMRQLGGNAGEIAWDGRDEHGRPVPSGVYFARVFAPDAESSRVLRVTRLR